MLLYIVRHAPAGERGDSRYPDDALRPLMKTGRERFAKCLKRLARGGFAPEKIATSPLVRCRQTAQLIAQRCGQPRIVELAALKPGSDLARLIDWTNQQQLESVAWVGHSPDVERWIVRLIGARDSAVEMAKGAVAAIEFPAGPIAVDQGTLRWLVTPKSLGA